MNLSDNEKKLLAKLITLDIGDMAGAHWPIGTFQKELGIELDGMKHLTKGLEGKKLVTLKGGAPCICITPNGKKALETSA